MSESKAFLKECHKEIMGACEEDADDSVVTNEQLKINTPVIDPRFISHYGGISIPVNNSMVTYGQPLINNNAVNYLPKNAPLSVLKSKFSSAAERWINTPDLSLTIKQRRVLLWIAMELKGKKQTVIYFYRRISGDLRITQKAVRSATSGLIKKKVLFDLGIAYNPKNPRQAIGKRFVIPQDIYTIIEFQLQDLRM